MSNYLHDNDWLPIIYSPENPLNDIVDFELNDSVHSNTITLKEKILEPQRIFNKLKSKKKGNVFGNNGKKKSLFERLSLYVRSNFFIPDARKFWIKPSIRYLSNYLKHNNIDVIISTGPPHSTHLIANELASTFNIPWVADFRDPWTQIDYFDQLTLTSNSLKKHKYLEKHVLQSATRVVTVSNTWRKLFNKLGERNDTVCITNGYEPKHFDSHLVSKNDKFIISHLGVMNQDRNFEVLWITLKALLKNNTITDDQFELQLYGLVDDSVLISIQKYGLQNVVIIRELVPHSDAIKIMQSSNINLLLINNKEDNNLGRLPSKLYEYIGVKKPILSIGPKESDASEIVSTLDNCINVEYDDFEGCYDFIKIAIENFIRGKAITIEANSSKFIRENLTKEYTNLLNELSIKNN